MIMFDETFLVQQTDLCNETGELDGFIFAQEQMQTLIQYYIRASNTDPPLAKEVMLFVWKCIQTGFQFNGPHFLTNGGSTADEVLQMLHKVLALLHRYGFKTLFTICDGCQVNFATLCFLSTMDKIKRIFTPWSRFLP